jgi:hypothetical protein
MNTNLNKKTMYGNYDSWLQDTKHLEENEEAMINLDEWKERKKERWLNDSAD